MVLKIDGEIFTDYLRDYDKVELEQYFSDFFKDFFYTLQKSGLNLTTLKQIRFTYDYSSSLIEFQREHNLKIGHSENGFGKVETLFVNETIEHYIFMHPTSIVSIFLGSQFDDKDLVANKILFLNAICHELCHLHDDVIILERFGFLEFRFDNLLDNVLYSIAHNMWSEYFAHRVSNLLIPMDVCISGVKEELLSFENTIGTIHIKDKELIYQHLHKYIEFLVRQIGAYHGVGKNDAELIGSLEGTIVHKYYNQISSMLNQMFLEYPHWKGYEILDELTYVIKIIWEDLGFKILPYGNDFNLLYKTI